MAPLPSSFPGAQPDWSDMATSALGQISGFLDTADDVPAAVTEMPEQALAAKSKRAATSKKAPLALSKVGRKSVLKDWPGPVIARKGPLRGRKLPASASLRLALGAYKFTPSAPRSTPEVPRFQDIAFIIRLEWQRHGKEMFEDTTIAIGAWQFRSDPDRWGFELRHEVTGERMKFITRWFDVQRLLPCLGCETSQSPSSKCTGYAPCSTCLKKGNECIPQKRSIRREDFQNVGFYGNGDNVVTDPDLLPLGTSEDVHGGVAETIQLHTVKTDKPSKAIVLSNLPCPRDKVAVEAGRVVFDHFPDPPVSQPGLMYRHSHGSG
jgi:hypothetical protein